MAEMFQEYHKEERQTRASLHSFLSTNNLHDTFFEDNNNNNDFRQQQKHPSRMPDTEVDEVIVPRRFTLSARTRIQKKNYAKRQNLIKRGRALIQRGREPKQEKPADDVPSVVSSFSIDDGSYKDDLRRSILEEEASRRKIKQPHSYYREGKYRELKSDIDLREEEEEERVSRATSSTTSTDKNYRNTKNLGHLPINNHEKVERDTTKRTSSNAKTRDATHSIINTTETVSSRIRMWEQGTTSTTSSGKSSTLPDERKSSSTDARQRTEERLLYLKQFLKDRDASHQVTAATPKVSANSPEVDVTDCISVETPPHGGDSSRDPTLSTRSKEPSTNEKKQKQSALVKKNKSPQDTGTIGISSGFPFPRDADITIGTSCNVSELTTTISSKEETQSKPSSIKTISKTAPKTSEESQVQVTKPLDDMNHQTLPKPKVSKPPTKVKSTVSLKNEKRFKSPVPRESKPLVSQSTTIPAKEEQVNLSSSHRYTEPLRSLLDFDDSQEDGSSSSIDRPTINIVASFEQQQQLLVENNNNSYPMDEPQEGHQVDDSMPVRATYSKMMSTHDASSRPRVDEPPSDARSIACPDSDSNEPPKEKKTAFSRTEAMVHVSNYETPPHAKTKSGKNVDKRPIKMNNIQAAEGHNAPVRVQPVPPTPKPENEVIAEFEQLESDELIVEVASTLTDSMLGGKILPSRPTSKLLLSSIHEGSKKSTPSLRRSKRALVSPDGDYSVDMSVSYKDGTSFDSKESVEETGELIWRMDPLDSLSDFILQIRDKESGENNQYHVHKHRLACGPRKSAHLDNLFQEHSTSSTHFSLGSKACEVFPSVLDFMYGDDFEIEFTTTTVVVYRGIGYKLQINALVAATTRFIREDMQVSNMTSYVSDMEVHGKLGMRKIMAEKCASKIEHISELDSLWIIMDPDLFRETVSNKLIDRTKISQHLSMLIAEYTALHKHEMTKAMFGKLSSSAIIPKIAREAALPLLEICFSYGSPREFEGLQKRCALTMATYWKITNENDRQRLFALLRNLPSSFTVDFLEKVDTGKMTSLLNFSLSQDYQSAEEAAFGSDIERDDTFSIDENETEYVGWRIHPDLSYSDWVIRVKSGTNSSADAYYVHKHVLAVGKQKSTFFASVFSTHRDRSITRGSTSVSLDHDAAKLFPRMLDFMYSKGKQLDICTQTVLPLRFLARTFQVYALNQEIIEFMQRDLCLDNVSQYLENADSFNDKGITGMVIDFVAANIEEIDIDSELLNDLEPNIFRRIISSEAIDHSASDSYHVPILIAKYFYIHELDETLLEDILGNYDMEQLDCLDALKLLQIICRLEMRESSFFLTLRDKCTDVLTDSWDDFRASFRNEVFAIMLTLDTETVAQIFDKVENRCYEKIEPSDEIAHTSTVPTTGLQSRQSAPTESVELERRQERRGGHVIMPPASTKQFISPEHPENRQPEPSDDRPSIHSMASGPSEEMRVSNMASAPSEEMHVSTMASAPSEELRVSTMATLPSKELWANTMASSPSAEILAYKQTAPSESCQIFSCGLMSNE